jgi:flagella basal body P-ring formation protein FlgA
MALSWSAAQGTEGKPEPSSPPVLLQAARAWAASLPGAGPQAAEFVPTDPRVAASPCASGWRFDLPFADPRAVRARCEQPRAQVFLRALQALRSSQSPAPSAASAPDPAPLRSAVRVAPSPAPAAVPGVTVTSGASGTSAASTATATGDQASPAAAPNAAHPVVVLRADLRRGERLDPTAVESVRLDAPPRRSFGVPVEDPTTLEHMEMVRDKQAGQVLYTHDIQPALLVRRGQLIAVTMQGVPGLRISVRLEALQDGRHGQSVRLRNTESGRIVSAVVTGPGEARLP